MREARGPLRFDNRRAGESVGRWVNVFVFVAIVEINAQVAEHRSARSGGGADEGVLAHRYWVNAAIAPNITKVNRRVAGDIKCIGDPAGFLGAGIHAHGKAFAAITYLGALGCGVGR